LGLAAAGPWLRAELRRRRISQRLLAQRSGIDHSTISRIISGSRSPTLDTLASLAKGLRIVDADVASLLELLTLSVAEDETSADQIARAIENAVRADPVLSEQDVNALLEQYRAAHDAVLSRALAGRDAKSSAARK
jgi:transcriptional regulator with XRE-family HTH domain